jgi:hypothetical protein
MAFPHPPARPEQELPQRFQSHPLEIVWGAPSDEMLEAEYRGEIILVEDIQRRDTLRGEKNLPTSTA